MFRVPPLTPRDAVRMLGCLAGIETKKEKTMPEETKNPWIEYSKGYWTREFRGSRKENRTVFFNRCY